MPSRHGLIGRRSTADRDTQTTGARSRRRFARRQWRRRWLSWKPLLALLLVLGLVGGGAWVVFFSRYLAVQDVQVSGTGLLSADDIRGAARVPDAEPLARVDLDGIERRVEALAPVKSADAVRQWPDRVLITVVERTPIAVVDIGGRIRGMDDAGVIFRDYPRAPRNLPLVKTTGRTGGEALSEAAQVVSALPTSLARRVAYIAVETVDQITLVLRDGRQVVWGSAEDSAAKAEVLVALLKEPARRYDVSVPGQPTTSQQATAAP
ncbi:MAG: cell division protein FtsQ/DivIB [Nocardioides sp.]